MQNSTDRKRRRKKPGIRSLGNSAGLVVDALFLVFCRFFLSLFVFVTFLVLCRCFTSCFLYICLWFRIGLVVDVEELSRPPTAKEVVGLLLPLVLAWVGPERVQV